MTKRMEYSPAGTPMIVEYLHDNPPPRQLTSRYLENLGFKKGPGNSYTRNDMTVLYDGVKWHCQHQCVSFEVKTVEDIEKLLS